MKDKQKIVEKYLEFLDDEENPLSIEDYVATHYAQAAKDIRYDFINRFIELITRKYRIDEKTIVEVIYDIERRHNSGFFEEEK